MLFADVAVDVVVVDVCGDHEVLFGRLDINGRYGGQGECVSYFKIEQLYIISNLRGGGMNYGCPAPWIKKNNLPPQFNKFTTNNMIKT